MKFIATITILLGVAFWFEEIAGAQEPQRPQYQQPPQPYFQPIGDPIQRYQMVVPPNAIVYPPPCYRPQIRATWGIWPIPIPLGYVVY